MFASEVRGWQLAMSASQGNHYLLEIGTEELPLEFLLSAPTELVDKVRAALDEQGLSHGELKMYVTPRRLALLIEDLPELQEARTFKTKGPPIRVALDASGNPTPAGLGFARKVGVEFSQLVQETIDNETYMVLNQTAAGRATQEVLVEILPELVLSLSGSHFMAWGHHTTRFSRPIRWLVSLWNRTHLPLTIGPVASGVESFGHRVLSDSSVRIESVMQYLPLLEKEGAVIADQHRRRELIWSELQKVAKDVGGHVIPNEKLLDTVNMLVENPSVVLGEFEPRFLELPEIVITTVMTNHQKYFAVKSDNGKLKSCFMTISNGRREAAKNIAHGNEKVLVARLEDARFFYKEDQKVSLENRLESLKGITFQKGLGSMYEKALRLEKLSEDVARSLAYSSSVQHDAARAGRLAKTDLVTGMVFEFTELQGEMGSCYAKLQQEPAVVAEAIYEHYLPNFAGDKTAQSQVGIAVSLADKIDTLVAVFSQKNAKLPSGSKDPLGLRRLASGLIQTVLENNLKIDLVVLMRQAYRRIAEDQASLMAEAAKIPTKPGQKEKSNHFQDENTTFELANTFVLQRLRGWLLEQDNRYDVIDAVFSAETEPLSDLRNTIFRLNKVKQLTSSENLFRIYEPANRVYKMLAERYNPSCTVKDIKPALFKDEAETHLFNLVKLLEQKRETYGPENCPLEDSEIYQNAILDDLALTPHTINSFFDKVMVNDPVLEVQENRYNLLSVLNRFYLQVACFSKVVV
jgi:glycyl-tRNA synthetase beta chain